VFKNEKLLSEHFFDPADRGCRNRAMAAPTNRSCRPALQPDVPVENRQPGYPAGGGHPWAGPHSGRRLQLQKASSGLEVFFVNFLKKDDMLSAAVVYQSS